MAERIAVKSQKASTTKRVLYCPPSAVEMRAYVQSVCQKLAGEIDAKFDTPEFNYELIGFMKVVASIYSKHLNKATENLDREAPQE